MSPHAMMSIRRELADREELAATRGSLEELAERLESNLQSRNDLQMSQLHAMLNRPKEEMPTTPKLPAPETAMPGSSSAPAYTGEAQEEISALRERISASENSQNALSRQMAQILSLRMREPDASDTEARIGALRTELARDADKRLAVLESTFKERLKQCERRSAEAINEMGTQVARITERLQADQSATLSSVQRAVSTARKEQDEQLSEVFAKMERGLEEAQHHSQNAIDPLKTAISSLARRLDTVDETIAERLVPAGPPAGQENGSRRANANHGNRPDSPEPEAVAPPVPPPEQQRARYVSAPPPHDARIGGAPRYSASEAIPDFADTARMHERRMQDQIIRSARQSLQSVGDGDPRTSAAFTGMMDKQRGKLPLMAASALALAVAGGGALTMMRGKPDASTDAMAPSSTDDSVVAATESSAVAATVSETDPFASATASIGETDTVALQATQVEPLRPETPEPESPRRDSASLYRQGLRHLAQGEKILGAERLTTTAESGMAIAQYRLAKLYEKGEGVPRSISTAREWTNKAARNGNVSAMHDLAVFYAQGDGGLQNYALSAEWFERAAGYGLVDSQYNLGVLYEKGQGVPRDLEKAAFWYSRAGMSGDADGERRAQELGKQAEWLDMQGIKSRARVFVAKAEDPVANGHAFRTISSLPPPPPSLIADAQRLLIELGYNPGTADGITGSRTRRAVKSFQLSYRMTPTGIISSELVKRMRTALVETKR